MLIAGLLVLPLLSVTLPPLEILPAAVPAPEPLAVAMPAVQVAPLFEPVHWGWFGWGAYAAIAVLVLIRISLGRVRLARLWRASTSAAPWLQGGMFRPCRSAGD